MEYTRMPSSAAWKAIASCVALASLLAQRQASAFVPPATTICHSSRRTLCSTQHQASQLLQDDDLTKLTVVVLKERLREVGLPVSGRKADLVARLEDKASKSRSSVATAVDIAGATIEKPVAEARKMHPNKTVNAVRTGPRFAQAVQITDKAKKLNNELGVNTSKRRNPGTIQITDKEKKSSNELGVNTSKKRNPGKRERMANRKWTTTSSCESAVIDALLQKRDMARKARNFKIADAILDELLSQHYVYLDDATRTYDYLKQRAGASWTRRGGKKQPLSETKLAEILELIKHRDEMRRTGDYDAADKARDDLAGIYGVRLDDNDRMWWTTSVALREQGDQLPTSGGWMCANDDRSSTDMEDLTSIETMVRDRDAARKAMDYDSADAIREELMSNFGVHLDDGLKMWWTASDGTLPVAYLQAKGGNDGKQWDSKWKCDESKGTDAAILSDEEKTSIQGMLMAREDARRKRNYAAADKIRDDLRSMHNVHLDDVEHTWSVWTREDTNYPTMRRSKPSHE